MLLSSRISIALCSFFVLSGYALDAHADQTKPAKTIGREFARGDEATTAGISGLASSARNCVGPSGAVIHPIGWVPGSSEVVITFSSDFDPVAAVTLVQLGQDAPDGLAR